jgi:TBC1 domain family member 8/9
MMGNSSSKSPLEADAGYLGLIATSRLMRAYFNSLDDSANPNSSDPRARAITKFQELLLISFREFGIITEETILSERRRFRNEVISSLEAFSKRSAIRNLKSLERFNKEQVGFIYDALFKAVCVEPPPPNPVPPQATLVTTKDFAEERPETRVGLNTFRVFLSEIATWARDEKIVMNGFQVHGSATERILELTCL